MSMLSFMLTGLLQKARDYGEAAVRAALLELASKGRADLVWFLSLVPKDIIQEVASGK